MTTRLEKMEMWVGRYITHWAYIDEKLFDICLQVLRAPQQQTAIVFYKTPSFETRIALIDELMSAFFPKKKPGEHDPALMKEWKDLAERIRENLPVRNALAHHPIKELIAIQNEPFRVTKATLSIRVGLRQRFRGRPGKFDRIDADRLPQNLRDVKKLDLDLKRFLTHLQSARHG